MFNSIKFIFMPRWWVQNLPYCKGLDIAMNELMDKGEPVKNVTQHHCNFGGMTLWIENHPYSSCQFQGSLPSRATRERFFNYMSYQLAMDCG